MSKIQRLVLCICFIGTPLLLLTAATSYESIYDPNAQPAVPDTYPCDLDREMVVYIAQYLSFFPNLEFAEVVAVINQESSFRSDVVAYESNVQDYSYGPMQIRLNTARWLGFSGDPELLRTWEYGLFYGMRYLSLNKRRAVNSFREGEVPTDARIRKRMFSMYNAGGLYWERGYNTSYINTSYVHSTLRYYYKFITVNAWYETNYA